MVTTLHDSYLSTSCPSSAIHLSLPDTLSFRNCNIGVGYRIHLSSDVLVDRFKVRQSTMCVSDRDADRWFQNTVLYVSHTGNTVESGSSREQLSLFRALLL